MLTLGDETRARTRVRGEVIDYTGKELKLKLSAGGERTFKPDQVVDVETPHSAEHERGLQLLAQREYLSALQSLESAARSEQRRWVRREILADIVLCYAALGDFNSAGSYSKL